jgi:hypothetical protein
MKKNSTVAVGRKQILKQAKWTIGLDLGIEPATPAFWMRWET